MKIALAQINPTVGDFTGNLEKIVAASRRAAEAGARLTVFSELAICGYPPADFLEKPSFLTRCRSAVDELAAMTSELNHRSCCRSSLPAPRGSGKPAVNAAVLLDRGRLLLEQHKRLLPFYDVFDEQRYFAAARSQQVVELDGVRLAITICEDAWNDKNFWPRRLYKVDPMEELMRQNPAVHINLSSSPFWHSKRAVRREMLAAIAKRDGVPVLMVNQVGGNDSLIFDGSSLALNGQGELIAQAASFQEDLVVLDPFKAPADPRAGGRRNRGSLSRAGAGHTRLRAQVRLQEGAGGVERRHRFRAGGGHRQRCARRGERDRAWACRALTPRAAPSTTAASLPPTWAYVLK